MTYPRDTEWHGDYADQYNPTNPCGSGKKHTPPSAGELPMPVTETDGKHTKGPWHVRKWACNMTVTGNLHQITDAEGYPVAFVPAWDAPRDGEVDGTEEAIANAHVISGRT